MQWFIDAAGHTTMGVNGIETISLRIQINVSGASVLCHHWYSGHAHDLIGENDVVERQTQNADRQLSMTPIVSDE
jgi:hypothetical protein